MYYKKLKGKRRAFSQVPPKKRKPLVPFEEQGVINKVPPPPHTIYDDPIEIKITEEENEGGEGQQRTRKLPRITKLDNENGPKFYHSVHKANGLVCNDTTKEFDCNIPFQIITEVRKSFTDDAEVEFNNIWKEAIQTLSKKDEMPARINWQRSLGTHLNEVKKNIGTDSSCDQFKINEIDELYLVLNKLVIAVQENCDEWRNKEKEGIITQNEKEQLNIGSNLSHILNNLASTINANTNKRLQSNAQGTHELHIYERDYLKNEKPSCLHKCLQSKIEKEKKEDPSEKEFGYTSFNSTFRNNETTATAKENKESKETTITNNKTYPFKKEEKQTKINFSSILTEVFFL